MALLTEIRTKLITAMKSQNETEKSVFRVVLGEVSRLNKEPSDEDVKRIIKKLIESNESTIKALLTASPEHEKLMELAKENDVLGTLIPKTLSVQEIKNQVFLAGAPIYQTIIDAKSDGQAIGACIKYMKSYNYEINGDDVKRAVTDIRAGEVPWK